MLKELVQYLINLGTSERVEVNGQQYSTQPVHLLEQPRPNALTIRNLTGLVDYLKSNYDKLEPVIIQVKSPTEVNVYSTFNNDARRAHFLHIEAEPPQIPFERFQSVEAFNILLQSCFVPTDDQEKILKVVGNVTDGQVTTFGDDGTSQTVTAKVGVATVDNVKVPNPVILKPFRTFIEIEQPASQFVFRMRSGDHGPTAALYEADGGAWKLSAIHAIRNYLLDELDEQVLSKQVTIIA